MWLTLQALFLSMIFLKYGMLFLQQMYDIQEVYKNSRIIPMIIYENVNEIKARTWHHVFTLSLNSFLSDEFFIPLMSAIVS